jgi:glucan-binding YG repeat protein
MTIAQQLKVTKFPFVIKNDAGNTIYIEDSSGWWNKREYDDKGNRIYFENRDGYWEKREFNDNGNQIYFEDNTGRIVDSRLKLVPEYTMEELVDKLGHNFKIKK